MFDVPVVVRPPKESRSRRLTRRAAEQLAIGLHPANGRSLFVGTGETCASCKFHVVHRWDKTYHKCEKHRLGLTHGDATDIRVGWPACVLFEAAK